MSKERTFKKEPPSDDAKKFFIVCEGAQAEADYFRYFRELDTRIELEVIPPEDGDNNSPTGLHEKWISITSIGPDGEPPKYDVEENDDIWFVIDTDKWGDKIDELRALTAGEEHTFVAQSNPCFEVWLCYHFSPDRQEFAGDDIARQWKKHLPKLTERNFDFKKHPILIRDAMLAARNNYTEINNQPGKGSTQVYQLAERIYALIYAKIDSAYHKMAR